MLGKPMSFDEYSAAVAEYTPEHVEKLSGVPAEQIRMLGDLFGGATCASPACGAWA